ncbi:VOC family protein [Tenacibaculum xiamenense]|uniref:VOC family protein n=1 Tax=Tenacibaculum xiamenense TaxID=1261553 RepID=UPI0038952F8F
MRENNFVFADLSTYDLVIAKSFYSNVFDWSYPKNFDDYLTAKYQTREVSGLYEMPEKFRRMKMPSFWMSYIQVNDIDKTLEKAKELGGTIEFIDKEQLIGKIALIRDPLGAGFTVYEGDSLNARFEDKPNTFIWSELFISDFSKVKMFYEGVFNWKLEEGQSDRFFIKNREDVIIGAIQELDSKIKGDKEYWSVFFGVANIEQTKEKVLQNGGKLVYEDVSTTVLSDPFGAFFHVSQIRNTLGTDDKKENTILKKRIKWKALLGIALIVISFITGWLWIWGFFFLLWVIYDVRSGITHLLEPISKKESPFLFWVIIGLWTFVSMYSFSQYLAL